MILKVVSSLETRQKRYATTLIIVKVGQNATVCDNGSVIFKLQGLAKLIHFFPQPK